MEKIVMDCMGLGFVVDEILREVFDGKMEKLTVSLGNM
jgi:hypothetical protein